MGWMGIKKGRPEFVAFINECIRKIKVDGTWVRLCGKWVQPVTRRGLSHLPTTSGQSSPPGGEEKVGEEAEESLHQPPLT
jgi:hypothetical protein